MYILVLVLVVGKRGLRRMLMPVLSAVCNYSSQDTNVIGYEIKQHGASTHMSGQGGLLVLGLVTGKQRRIARCLFSPMLGCLVTPDHFKAPSPPTA